MNEKLCTVVTEWFSTRLKSVLEEAIKQNDSNVLKFCKTEIYPMYFQAVKTNGETSVPEQIYFAFNNKYYAEAIEEDESNNCAQVYVGRG